jgi:hypothetical protein
MAGARSIGMPLIRSASAASLPGIGAATSAASIEAFQPWERRGSCPPTLSRAQRDSLQTCARTLARAEGFAADLDRQGRLPAHPTATPTGRSPSDTKAPDTPPAETRLDMPDSATDPAASAQPARSWSWLGWTAALGTLRGLQGALGTFAGRLAQEGLRTAVGVPQSPEEVNDEMLAAGGATCIALGAVAAARAGLHTWRATGNPEVYGRAFRGLPQHPAEPASAIAMVTAGTPRVPMSRLGRAAASATVAAGVFGLMAHTGLIALSQVHGNAPNKHEAYAATWNSVGNSLYGYARETVNAVIDGAGLISHHAPLTSRGAIASSAQYLPNALAQRAARHFMQPGQTAEFDWRFPYVSAAAEFVDVGTVALSARIGSPEQPVSFLRGRVAEQGGAASSAAHEAPTLLETLDRITQRASHRALVAEVFSVVPSEIGDALRPSHGKNASTAAAWVGSTASPATHVREPLWQAESAVIRHAQAERSRLEQLRATARTPGPGSNAPATASDADAASEHRHSVITQDIDNIV